ncbi:MAG: TRAP transporter small permease subunit [Rhodobacteraceae bacterium]|nr:TRAP transporter small permease subunit [Paracoccaceae bacterium]
MRKLAGAVDVLNHAVAMTVRWLVLAMALIQFAIVVIRYAFGVNSIAAQESVLYLHAAIFMLGAGYTLAVDKHVRVDVFYAKVSAAKRRAIDITGHCLLLIPAMLALLYWSWASVMNSWTILEGPISVGGLQAVFLMKSLTPLFCVLLLLQSLAHLTRLLTEPVHPEPPLGGRL